MQDLLHRCSAGLDTAALQREVLRSLRRVLPVDAAFFATADPDTLLFTGALSEEPLVAAAALFLDNELAGADVNTFPGLATSGRPVATLDAATRHDRRSSARYRDIMRPLGLGDELRAALLAGGDCWGYLCLHRADGVSGFTAAEAATVARLAPHVAEAVRRAVLSTAAGGPADLLPGVVVLTDGLEPVAATPEAEHLLSLVTGPGTSGSPVPFVVRAVAAALRACERGISGRPPSARVPLVTGGWLSVHASRLRGPGADDRITVVLEPTARQDTVPLLLSAHGLTRREAEVARLVLRGTSTQGVVEALHISRWTVQDHLKAVFDKVGVRSRRELAARLLADRLGGG